MFFLDFPSIISGDKVVFLEPQEQVWNRQSGRSFALKTLSGTDHLSPFEGIAGFSSSNPCYSKTLFRFPLRQKASEISENVYSVQGIHKLIEALRSEAKLLLLFLQSVCTIEVHKIDNLGVFAPLLQVKITNNEFDKKKSFYRLLKSYFASQQSHVSSVTLKFDVCVNDSTTGETTYSHWFVDNRVDSTNATVRNISNKLKLLPWVGTAVELDSPGNGRIFCFLPVPAIDNASNLPVHVNGMFGLTDDRRSLKWPTEERRNDPMADWNQLLVKHVLHPCYIELLLEGKFFFHGSTFYKAWPDVAYVTPSWRPILDPLVDALLSHNVILTESGEWVSPNTPIYLPKKDADPIYLPKKDDECIPPAVKVALSNCHVKLAEVPETVWRVFEHAKKFVTEVSPSFVLERLRDRQDSYVNLSPSEKLELLKYCLPDKNYLTLAKELISIQLLPLADGSFISFEHKAHPVYVCTGKCPIALLPNLGDRLVNLPNQDLQLKMIQIARGKMTQLTVLDESAVSELLVESMPSAWKYSASVTFPHGHFNSGWLQTFWKWLQNQQLSLFQDRLIFPVRNGTTPVTEQFSVVRLSKSVQSALCIPSDGDDDTLFSILDKFGIRYCMRSSFGYIRHQALANYVKTYPEGLFESIAATQNFSVELSLDEAKYLRRAAINNQFLDRWMLLRLKIYSSCANTGCRLYPINNTIMFEPKSHPFNLSLLSPDIVIISSSDSDQVELLKHLGHDICSQSVTNFIKSIVRRLRSLRSHQYDSSVDQFLTDALYMYRKEIPTEFQDLPFVKVASGTRKRPSELYDPHDACLTDMLFQETDSFPSAPYNTPECVNVLVNCGLHSTVMPQKILDIIYSISLPASSSPQPVSGPKMRCALAILDYLASSRFRSEDVSGYFTLDSKISSTPVSFQEALMLLSCQRCWLPVLSKRPRKCLPWKGTRYTSHFITLGKSVYLYSSNSYLPILHGSRAYFTHPCSQLSNNNTKSYQFYGLSVLALLCAFLFFIFFGH